MVPGFSALSAYSVPLEICVEQGILGIASFALLMLTVLVNVLLCVDDGRMRSGRKLFAIAMLVGIIGSVTYGLFDTIWYRPSVNLLFWWMVAVVGTFQSKASLHAYQTSSD
jgi:putative inorganic carbon (HCO3(-)) transporter